MKVSDYIVTFLKKKGISCVFELSGGMIMQLIDSFHCDGEIEIVTMHHEQASSFAADAVGRISGKPGVAIATSGPGATNLLTGIGSCYFDSSPALFITGQVNRKEQKGDLPIRQLGFQETDIVSMATPITKYAFKVSEVGQVESCLETAYNIALEGRPGPVLLDIPMDIFRAEMPLSNFCVDASSSIGRKSDDFIQMNACILNILEDIQQAKCPLILAGGGVNAANSVLAFRQLIKKLNVPVVYSLMAVDVLSSSDPLKIGLIGTYGNRWANIALHESDLLIVMGSRLDIRQTGADVESFAANKKIYHIDCESEEINNRVKGCVKVVSNLRDFLAAFLAKEFLHQFHPKSGWLNAIEKLKMKWPDVDELKEVEGINPNVFMKQLSIAAQKKECRGYSVDVGQHQMWAAQSIRTFANQRFVTSGGMGAMGFSLPAAIGMAFSSKKSICVISGDAGLQLNIQELQTVVRNSLPIKIIVINNKAHGMTRQFQETYFGKRYQSTLWGYTAPDFSKIALAYGIKSKTIFENADIETALEEVWFDNEPFLLQVMIDSHLNVYPKLAFGLPLSQMEPFAKPIEMEGT